MFPYRVTKTSCKASKAELSKQSTLIVDSSSYKPQVAPKTSSIREEILISTPSTESQSIPEPQTSAKLYPSLESQLITPVQPAVTLPSVSSTLPTQHVFPPFDYNNQRFATINEHPHQYRSQLIMQTPSFYTPQMQDYSLRAAHSVGNFQPVFTQPTSTFFSSNANQIVSENAKETNQSGRAQGRETHEKRANDVMCEKCGLWFRTGISIIRHRDINKSNVKCF